MTSTATPSCTAPAPHSPLTGNPASAPPYPPGAPGLAGLAALEARLAQDLAWLELPPPAWVPPSQRDGQPVLDVAVIGGGMAGLTAATALRHLGITAVIFDQAPAGFEGPWATTARMETLRSPKTLTGPALGLPALTFRAWYEAQYGVPGWEALDKIPRLQWMDYLRWYRKVMGLDLRNAHRLSGLRPRGDGVVALDIANAEGTRTLLARRVVLATGRDGLGGAQVPAFVNGLPRERWAHSSEVLDAAMLAGKRVGVVGAGSSAMDSAATALEANAQRVDMLVRRADIPRINKQKAAGNPGLVHGHQALSDAWKWRFRHYINREQVPPPRGSTLRVMRHPNVRVHLSSPVLKAEMAGDEIHVTTPRGVIALDFLFLSTGFRIDWFAREEFATIAPHVRAWHQRYAPPSGDEDQELHDSPDVGPAFELREKTPGACPGLARVYCFNYPAALSHGAISGDIPAISDGARRLAEGIASALYVEDIDQHFARLEAFNEPEVFGDEWADRLA